MGISKHDGQALFVPSFSYGDRTRSFLKIQDGCDYFCTYCTIPLARGRSRSDTVANAVANAGEIIRNGIREIILTGVNIGDFGRHNGENFGQLIRALDQVEGLPPFPAPFSYPAAVGMQQDPQSHAPAVYPRALP